MKKFIVMLLPLFGASCFGTAMPYPGREVEINVLPIRLDDAFKVYPRTEATQAEISLYEGFLEAGADLTDRAASGANLKFTVEPFRWSRQTNQARLRPSSEVDLDYLFDTLHIGPAPTWEYRTLIVHFVLGLPSPSVLTSGRYSYGSYQGVSWAYRNGEWPHEVAFAYANEPQTPSTEIFAEAFGRFFFQKHGIQAESVQRLGANYESLLRTSLMSRFGLGHFDPNMAPEIRREPGQVVFQINCSDVVAGRCHRLEYSTDLKTWNELWFQTYQVSYTQQSPLRIRFLLDKKAAFYRFVQCPDRL